MNQVKELNWEGFCHACGKNCFNTCEQSIDTKPKAKPISELLDVKVLIESLEWRVIELEKHVKNLSKTLNSVRSGLDNAQLR